MKRFWWVGPSLLLCAFVFASPSTVLAQTYRRGTAKPEPAVAPDEPGLPGRSPVTIRKIYGPGRKGMVQTPVFQTSVGRGNKPLRDWGMISAAYETQPEWIDELTVTFYVLSLVNSQGKTAYSLYRRDVRYMDVKRGRDHIADVYLRPSALERYGEVVAVGVEFTVKGEVVAELGESSLGNQIPAKWWKDPKIVKSEVVTQRDGYLLTRVESPFGWINSDDYEAIK